MRRLTLLKHWQIFTLTFGFEILVSAFSSFGIISMALYRKIMPFASWFTFSIILLWLISINKLLESKRYSSVNAKDAVFPIACYVAIFSELCLGIWQSINGLVQSVAFVTITLANFGVLIYACLRISRLLRKLEPGLEITSESFMTILLLLLSPIGVWIIQPKINLIQKNSPSTERSRYKKPESLLK
jgi:hypothetical protein